MPFHQFRQMQAIFIEHCPEFQSQSTTGFYMPYDRPSSTLLGQENEG